MENSREDFLEVISTEGLITGYTLLVILAVVSVYVGSLLSVVYHRQTLEDEEVNEEFTMKSALLRPFQLSAVLISLYVFVLYKPDIQQYIKEFELTINEKINYNYNKKFINWILHVLIFTVEVTSLTLTGSVMVEYFLLFFKKNRSRLIKSFLYTIVFAISVSLSYRNFYNKKWININMIGITCCLHSIQSVSLNRVSIGCVLLGGLFIYDIFWVFGTDVMITVASHVAIPFKLMIPFDLPEKGLNASKFVSLGLGDIIVPGFFVALLCRFDFHYHPTKFRSYFWSSIIGYIIGLIVTIGVMLYFNAAQPALLYIVPACIGCPLLLALIRGEIGPLFDYKDRLLRGIDVLG